MKGESLLLNGDRWTVVDVAPAEPLAEMVATILEEEAFTVVVRLAAGFGDVLTHLGGVSSETTLVLVPEAQAEGALALIAETVTDYEGDELEVFLSEMGDASEEELEDGEEPGDEETNSLHDDKHL